MCYGPLITTAKFSRINWRQITNESENTKSLVFEPPPFPGCLDQNKAKSTFEKNASERHDYMIFMSVCKMLQMYV